MITMHIVDYLVVIIANALQYLFYYGGLKAYEISDICDFVVYLVSNVIFGLIVI